MSTAFEINSCKYLFLERLYEPEANSLCAIVTEGIVGKIVEPAPYFPDAQPIEPLGRHFEIVWDTYVGYCVKNESFATPEGPDGWTGQKFSMLESSRYMDYMLPDREMAEFVLNQKTHHWALICGDHVIEVVSVSEPSIRRIDNP